MARLSRFNAIDKSSLVSFEIQDLDEIIYEFSRQVFFIDVASSTVWRAIVIAVTITARADAIQMESHL
jgi:hypothetical protein